MTLQIFNTLTRKKEVFTPAEPGKVRMYVCGVTVYDLCHLGHARALVTFDIIYRALLHKGYDVIFVRNFTDIDDKIINRANEKAIPWQELAQTYIDAFSIDTAALGIKTPTIEPKATDHVSEMLNIIKTLEDKGLAYKAGGDVYYSVRKFDGYGKLSGKTLDDLEAGARVDVLEAKTDPLDFALWKGSKPGEPSWESVWGAGRPGWHIECSAMSMKYLGESFDIHGGGRDLIFPHHENEIAQSEGCTGKVFSRYWVHNGFVNINAEKMSKSLGNFLTIRDLLTVVPAEAIRLFILSAHYRSPLDYTDQTVSSAISGLERYYNTKLRLELFAMAGEDKPCDEALAGAVSKLVDEFEAALDDDFNTAKIVAAVFEILPLFNKALDDKTASVACVTKFLNTVRMIHDVLGIFGSEADIFLQELKAKHLARISFSAAELNGLIQKRREAKAGKDFKTADGVREELKEKGIQLKDNPDGTTEWSLI